MRKVLRIAEQNAAHQVYLLAKDKDTSGMGWEIQQSLEWPPLQKVHRTTTNAIPDREKETNGSDQYTQ